MCDLVVISSDKFRGAFVDSFLAIASNVGPAAPFPELITIFNGLNAEPSMKLHSLST